MTELIFPLRLGPSLFLLPGLPLKTSTGPILVTASLSLYILGLLRGKGRGKALLLSQPKERLVVQGKALTPSLHREGLQAQHWLSSAPQPTQCQSSAAPPTPENPE